MAKTTTARTRTAAKARTATRSASRRKPATRKPARAKAAPTRDGRTVSKIEAAARNIAHAQLGVAAHLVEAVGIRVTRARAEAPKQWKGLVKRGEQVRNDLEQASDELRRQIVERAAAFDPRASLEARVAKARTLLTGRRRAAA